MTTYYVRSTVLGGKTVTELDATGAWKSSTVYAEGMKLATYVSTFPTNVFSLHHMDPINGNEASSDGGAYSGGFSQLDPLGSDVTIAPDPNVYEEPLYLDPTSVFSSPIENRSQAWAWEGDIALADWGDRIRDTLDTIRAEHYWATGRRGLAIEIISQNPNVGINYRVGREFSGTIFGSQAAGFLTGLDRAIQNGLLVSVQDSPRLLGFTEKQGGMLGQQLAFMMNADCAKAFTDAGMYSPAKQTASGLTMMHEDFFGNSLNDSQWAPDSEFARGMRTMRNLNSNTNDVTWSGARNGKFYIGLTGRAFNEVDDFFAVSVAHSFIHSGGQPGSMDPLWTQQVPFINAKTGKVISSIPAQTLKVLPRHDLEWFGASYNRIIESCVPGGRSKIGPARTRN